MKLFLPSAKPITSNVKEHSKPMSSMRSRVSLNRRGLKEVGAGPSTIHLESPDEKMGEELAL